MKEKERKLFRLFLVAVLLMSVFTAGAQTVTKQFRNATVQQVLKEVERQTKMSVIYSVDDVQSCPRVTATFKHTPLREVLNKVLDGNLSYDISDRLISIHKRAAKPTAAAPVHQQAGIGSKRTVKGQVLDENGEPVIGATIRVKGGKTATVSDKDGNFQIEASPASTLEVSYLGYAPKEVSAHNDNVTVNMAQDTKTLSAVVVTALGIKKETKALSYNVQQINSSEVTGVKDANFMNSLAGKVAGVEINASSAGIGGGVKVVMRGAKSISNNNNALYVIDGIPMPSLQTTQPTDYFHGDGQSGDGISMINTEDIESISVLSGASASALYGSEAQNGVIMITTKRGKEGKTNVTYSNNTSFYSPFITPEFQNTYGSAAGEFSSWGEKMTQPSSYDPLDFFKTGFNVGNSVTLSTGNDKNQTFVSLASTNAGGIVINNTLNRYNFSIRNTSSMLKDKLHLDLAAMYMNVKENNMVSEGQYMNPLVPLYLMSPSNSLDTYQLFETYNASRGFKTQNWMWGNQGLGMQNPYWITKRDNQPNHKERYMMSAGLTWKFAKGFSLAARTKLDKTDATYEKKYNASTDAIFAGEYGFYERSDEQMRQIYADLILNIDKYFGDFSLTSNLGGSFKDSQYHFHTLNGNLSSVANLFSFDNMEVTSLRPTESDYHDQVQSLFGTAQIGWQSKIYLDLTGRIDWASALAGTTSSSVAYPSVGLTGILTDLIPGLKSNVLSFLKVRGSYSEVGNAPLRFVPYSTHPFASGTPATTTTYPNSDIKPERTRGWEVGVESHFWGNKINLNVSLYKTSTFNQLFRPTLPETSGYSSIYINGGQIDNKGIEVSLKLNQPLGPVDWNSSFTYSLNRNKVVKLLKETHLAGGLTVAQDHLDLVNLGNVKTMITEGGSMGDLYGRVLKQDDHGFIYVNPYTNEVMVDRTAGPFKDGYVKLGNSQPNYSMGWRNSFDWNGLSLNFLITARVGGEAISLTQALMDTYGVSKTTAEARDRGYVSLNGSHIPAVQKYYQTVGSGVASAYVVSATNVRLSELSLGYDVPINKWVPWVKGLNVAFTARNLFMIYCKSPFDPELTASTSIGFSGMDYFMMPSMRSLGFSARVNF